MPPFVILDSLHIFLISLILILLCERYIIPRLLPQYNIPSSSSQSDILSSSSSNTSSPEPVSEQVQYLGPTIPSLKIDLPPSQYVDFLLTVGKLKHEKRTGWVNHKVPLPESISDHMYRMSIMALFLRDGTIDSYRASTIALVHDIAEALVGDITPPSSSGVSVEHKHKLEEDAMTTISNHLMFITPGSEQVPPPLSQPHEQQQQQQQQQSHLPCKYPNTLLSNELLALYNTYSQAIGPEGKICKQLDKIEMIIQAYEYERDYNMRLDPFWNLKPGVIIHPYLCLVRDEIVSRRKQLWLAREQEQQEDTKSKE